MRLLIALGGNAMTTPDGGARPHDQRSAIALAMTSIARLLADGHEVVLTHGNGPQVGNLLVKNELAASVVPPVPLDWCGAQTQATIGFTIACELERALARLDVERPVSAVVTRTVVDGDDPGFSRPTKPVGRYVSAQQAAEMMRHGQIFEDRGERGWRRVVASPEPLEVLEVETMRLLASAGHVVVGAGGGGIPVTRREDGIHGVEAVIDKDLTAAVLAGSLGADALVIATDVDAAAIAWGTPQQESLGRVTVAQMREYAAQGHFASGSMGPKVEAALRFVEAGGPCSIITSLGRIGDAIAHEAGTIVVPTAEGDGGSSAGPARAADERNR